MSPNTNPFRHSKLDKPTDLIGRRAEVHALFSQITTTQSTALIGAPHIGKTSLLNYLADPQIRLEQLPDSTSWAFVPRNGHSLGTEETPTIFWRSVLQEALVTWNSQELKAEIETKLKGETLSNDTLNAVFGDIRRNGKKLVLLLDELEDLLGKAGLSRIEFWGHLRSLASLSPNALCYVTSSRIDPDERAEALKLQSGGSPLFNIARRHRLKPLPESEARQILAPLLTLADRNAILALAGGNPYVLQMLGSLMWEARMAGEKLAGEGYVRFALATLDELEAHFVDAWKYLDQTKGAQTLAVMFTLQELERRTHNLNYLEMASKVFPKPLKALKDAGLLTETSPGHLRLAGGAFAIWIAQNQMNQALDDPKTWLRENEKLAGPITRGQLEQLGQKLSSVYGEVKGVAIDLGTAIAKNRLGV